MNDTDLHTLAAAYALDALTPAEANQFERHLATCPSCQREVEEFSETASRLASTVELPVPDHLKASVLDEIDRTRQDSPVVVPLAPRRQRPRIALTAAAALAVVAMALGGVLGRVTSPGDDQEAIASILAASDAAVVVADGPGQSTARALVSAEKGEAVIVMAGMAPAPRDQTYELWLIGPDGAIPAGLFDVDASGVTTQLVRGDIGTAFAIGVTVEPAGGSSAPTSDPLVVLDLEST